MGALSAQTAAAYAGKQALVTGGASGIGRALVEALLAAGASVLATDRDEAGLATLTPHANLTTATLDVSDANRWREVVAGLPRSVDVLVNCAGMGLAGFAEDVRPEDWDRCLAVNLWGVIYGVQAVYPSMLARKAGVIINIASGAGVLPRPGMVPYATAKAAVVQLTRSLAPEAALSGVRIAAACPGYILTPMLSRTVYRGVDGAALSAKIPKWLPATTAADCAAIVLTRALSGPAVFPVGREVAAELWLVRYFPRLADKAIAFRVKGFASARVKAA